MDSFSDLCLATLDRIVSFRSTQRPTSNPSPWINNTITHLKGECQRAECRWKKSGLQVHYLHMKDLLTSLKVKDARASYFDEFSDAIFKFLCF